jgi:hypothetical protein
LVGDGHASFLSVENPLVGAFQADLVGPVPGSTAEVGRLGVVGGAEDASSVAEVVTLEASGTVTVGGVSFALIRDSDALLVSVENPSFGALEADLIVPVPSGASDIRRGSSVGGRVEALPVLEVEALVTGGAVTIVGVGLAVIVDGNTDLVRVENPVFGASQTDLIVPVPSSAA